MRVTILLPVAVFASLAVGAAAGVNYIYSRPEPAIPNNVVRPEGRTLRSINLPRTKLPSGRDLVPFVRIAENGLELTWFTLGRTDAPLDALAWTITDDAGKAYPISDAGGSVVRSARRFRVHAYGEPPYGARALTLRALAGDREVYAATVDPWHSSP